MSDALEKHDGKVSIGGRNITNLRFADDIDALAEEEQELEALVESLDKTCTRYKAEISAEKTKLMTISANGIQREIKVLFFCFFFSVIPKRLTVKSTKRLDQFLTHFSRDLLRRK